MSETETQAAPKVKLVKWREKLKTGMPTDGLVIFVGLPKSGKTTLAASFPDSYVLELEKGADRVAGRFHEIADLTEFREVLPVVAADPDVKTIVIDSIDVLSDWLCHEIAEAAGLDNIQQRKKDVNGFELWEEFRARIEGVVGFVRASGKLVILIAHTKEPKLDDNGTVVSPAGIAVPGKGGAYLAAQAEVIGKGERGNPESRRQPPP